MNRSGLIKGISVATGLNQKPAAAALENVIDAIISAVRSGDTVTLTGFGTFRVANRKERIGRDPQTGKTITIAAHKTPKFLPAKGFRDALK